MADAAAWDRAYQAGAESVSWHEDEPRVSLELIVSLGVPPDAPILDVGGGASPLAARLLERGHRDVTVLDLSEGALREARARAGDRVGYLRADVLTWRPDQAYGLWHDRATLHFFTGVADREAYVRTLHAAVAPGGSVVLGVFAPDGPERCSGLPVRRYSADALAQLLGCGYERLLDRQEVHVTPRGARQAFTWAAFRRLGAG